MAKSGHDIFAEGQDLIKEPTNKTASLEDANISPSGHDIFASGSEQQSSPEVDSWLKTFGKKALQTGTMGFGDELAAAAAHPDQAAVALGNLFRDDQHQQGAEDYYKYKEEYLKNLAAGEEAHPSASWLGLGAGIAGSLIPAGAVMRGAGAVGSVLPGAAKIAQIGEGVEAANALRAAGQTAEAAAVMPSSLARLAAFSAKSVPTGAIFGGLAGAGESERGHVGEEALHGAQVGAVLGPAIEAIGGGAIKGSNLLEEQFSPYAKMMDAGRKGLKNIDYTSKYAKNKALTTLRDTVDSLNEKISGKGKSLFSKLEASKAAALEKTPINANEFNKQIEDALIQSGATNISTVDTGIASLTDELAGKQEAVNAILNKGKELEGHLADITAKVEQDPTSIFEHYQSNKSRTIQDGIDVMQSKLDDVTGKLNQFKENYGNMADAETFNAGKAQAEAIKLQAKISDAQLKLKQQAVRDAEEYAKKMTNNHLRNQSQIAAEHADVLDRLNQAKSMPTSQVAVAPQEEASVATVRKELSHFMDKYKDSNLNDLPLEAKQELYDTFNDLRNQFNNTYTDLSPKTQEAIDSVLRPLKEDLKKVHPEYADINSQVHDFLTSKELLGMDSGVRSTKDKLLSSLDTAKTLADANKGSYAGLFKQERLGEAEKLLDKAAPEIMDTYKQAQEKSSDLVKALKYSDENLPWYQHTGARLANISGRAIEGSIPAKVAGFLGNSANGTYIKQMAVKSEQQHPVFAKLLHQIADTQDAGKKRAIINIIQNSETLRRLAGQSLGVEDGDKAK